MPEFKVIEKLKLQEKRLVDLYLNSNLDVETINHKNDVIKKEIELETKLMNNYKNTAEEIVLNEYVFVFI